MTILTLLIYVEALMVQAKGHAKKSHSDPDLLCVDPEYYARSVTRCGSTQMALTASLKQRFGICIIVRS